MADTILPDDIKTPDQLADRIEQTVKLHKQLGTDCHFVLTVDAASALAEYLRLMEPLKDAVRDRNATYAAIRELLELPADGDIFDRLVEWEQDRIAGEIRLQNAVHNVLAERLYANGKAHHGVAVPFLMRLTMLANEAKLPGYHKGNPAVAEAIAKLGDPAHPNTAEDIGAPRYLRQCEAVAAADEQKTPGEK